jgi:membrane protein DedA with SNARE-associated domain
MLDFLHLDLHQMIGDYGYGLVFLVVTAESMGVPLPAETLLIGAAVYAGTTHRLDPAAVIGAAAAGAILGDNIGYLIGHELGLRLLRRYGPYVHIDERRLRLGQYLFKCHGSKVVFFGRFVAFLRTFAAILAGANQMHWRSFLLWNALGGIVWATLYGLGGYLLGNAIEDYLRPAKYILPPVALAVAIGSIIFMRRNEERLSQQADKALATRPGE